MGIRVIILFLLNKIFIEVNSIKGVVVNKIQGYYYVDVENVKYECKLKGKLKFSNKKDNCVVGDNVFIENGVISEIYPRENILYRPLVANLSKIVITFACKDPNFDINRFNLMLLNSFFYNVKPLVVINKIELLTDEELNIFKESLDFLKRLNIKVIYISTVKNIGIDLLEAELKNCISALGGPSGAGKSTIINLLQNDIVLETGETSKKTSRGRHTTKGTNLLNLNVGGYIIDTPGFSSLDIPPIESSSDLINLFEEFNDYKCKFNNCMHINEPQCGVKNALEKNEISKVRYDFYCYVFNNLKNERWNKYD